MSQLSAYEKSLSASQLHRYIQDEARTRWGILKSASLPYDEPAALADLFRARPQLYERYQGQVHKREPDTTPPLMSPEVDLLDPDEAYAELHGLASQYLRLRLATDEPQAMTKAIDARPDLYRAWCRPAPDQHDPWRQLQRLAKAYVAKRLASSEQDGMARAIQERPELYAAYRKSVQQPAHFRKVV